MTGAFTDRLADVVIDESGLPAPTPDLTQERRVAVFDLLEANRFRLHGAEGRPAPGGPYRLVLGIRERRFVFDVTTMAGDPAASFGIPLSPFQQIVKDYFQICETYVEAVRRLPAAQIEALDEARREIHTEGSRALLARLEPHVETDIATARRVFTLLCVLHPRG